MAKRPKIISRATSLATAFVHAIIPRREDPLAQARLYDSCGINSNECVYCGSVATDKDHLRALVIDGKPSGHFHTFDNIVPSCGACNQSKGSKEWQTWMRSSAARSPTTRMVPDIEKRIERLSKFEAATNSIYIPPKELCEAVDVALWDAYWARLEAIKTQMREADNEAKAICALLDEAYETRMAPIASALKDPS